MCGRYQRRSDKLRITEAFARGEVHGLMVEPDLALAPDYNVAPQTMQPVIIWNEAFGTRSLHMMFWRYLPPFCADPKDFKLSTVNAASHGLLQGMWKESFLKRRCLVPADTFVEWENRGTKKLPWIFAMKDRSPFALGGVWRHWQSHDGRREMDTFAIITVEPNELVATTTHHDRMPLIVSKRDWQRWLEPMPHEQPPIDLLRPFDADRMDAWRTASAINNVRNTSPELGEQLKEDGPQQRSFF
jgi:putative SOS response-associated peptidase YedK